LGQNGADSTKEWNAFHRISFYFFPFSVATPSNPIPNYPEIFSFQKRTAFLILALILLFHIRRVNLNLIKAHYPVACKAVLVCKNVLTGNLGTLPQIEKSIK
jgi:hypothetical protein